MPPPPPLSSPMPFPHVCPHTPWLPLKRLDRFCIPLSSELMLRLVQAVYLMPTDDETPGKSIPLALQSLFWKVHMIALQLYFLVIGHCAWAPCRPSEWTPKPLIIIRPCPAMA